jgi:hypothetical protein
VRLTLDAANSHAGASSNQGREGLAVGSNQLTALSRVGLGCVEVKDELLVIWEKSEAVHGRVGKEELGCEAQTRVFCPCCNGDWAGRDGQDSGAVGKDGESGGGEIHLECLVVDGNRYRDYGLV